MLPLKSLMGSSPSVPYFGTDSERKIELELTQFREGKFSKDSTRYTALLMCSRFIIDLDSFFTKTPIEGIGEFIEDMGILKPKEATRILKMLVKHSKDNRDAQAKIHMVLPHMRLPVQDPKTKKQIFITPITDAELYGKIVKQMKAKWGKFKPEEINFKDPEIVELKASQITITPNIINHNRDAAFLILENPVHCLWKRDVKEVEINFEKKISKPAFWKKSIYEAALKGDDSSIKYSLFMMPALLNCPNDKGNTLAHCASEGGRPKTLLMLHSLGADFNLSNDEGFLPLHMTSDKDAVVAMKSIGVDLNSCNSNGESFLEIKTKNFDIKIIETLLGFGINIFTPNPKGAYWMQFAIHGEYYCKMDKSKNKAFVKFQKFVRGILKKQAQSKTPPAIASDKLFQEMINRKIDTCENDDIAEIAKAVNNQDIPRIKMLLAFGAKPDTVRPDQRTNLMICAENGLTEMAKILADNFCDPNSVNERKENTFWVSAQLGYYETALVMRDHGGDMNALSEAGCTLLHIAYENRETQNELFTFLLEAGASVNTKDKDLRSVQFIAFFKRDDEIAEMLQDKYNGDISSQTTEGNTLAHIELLANDLDRVDYLIGRNIGLEVKNDYGHTIFMISMMVFDNLPYSKKLLDYGCDIDTQDNDGNTPLLVMAYAENFMPHKVDFLLMNNCDINLQNKSPEFPISVFIARQINDYTMKMLDMGCIINDPKSEFEPIANALKISSQFWVETLINRGANALNKVFPVLTTYINMPFFNFELMKQMGKFNTIIGAPMQAGMKREMPHVSQFLWDYASDKDKVSMTHTKDFAGQIPLSVAINYKYHLFVEVLIDKKYDVHSADNEGRTPFMYACISNVVDWMTPIWNLISLANANHVDRSGNSALTYAASNNNVNFCNILFCGNIEVFNINLDKNGIIDAYRQIIYTYNQLLDRVQDNVNGAKAALDSCESEYEHYRAKVNRLKSDLSSFRSDLNSLRYRENVSSWEVSSLENKIDNKVSEYNRNVGKLNNAVEKVNHATRILDKYTQRYNKLYNASRHDMLYNLRGLSCLAEYDGDFICGNNNHSRFNWGACAAVAGLCLLGIL